MAKAATILSTDVLVMGGGISGLMAANKAADQGVNVLIADKCNALWGGQMPAAGGGFSCMGTPDEVDADVRFITKEGGYLNDQDLLHAFVRDCYPALLEAASGVCRFPDISGSSHTRPGWMRMTDTDRVLPTLLGRVLKKSAKVLNKVYLVDLLKQGNGSIVGAVGFHYQTGDFYIIQSKATVIASGGPVKRGITENIDLNPAVKKDSFALCFDGYLYVKEKEIYYIWITSDDGSEIYLNNRLVLKNDGLHAADLPKVAVVPLSPGYYPLIIKYFEKAGEQSLAAGMIKGKETPAPQPFAKETLFYRE